MIFEALLTSHLVVRAVTGGAEHPRGFFLRGVMTRDTGLFGMGISQFKPGFGIVLKIEELEISFVTKMAGRAVPLIFGIYILVNVLVAMAAALWPVFHFK